jgi:uncharacterized protein DUF6169
MVYLLKNLERMVSDLQPYSYITYKPDYFIFTTNAGCDYHCYFFNFSAVFDEYPNLAPKVFGFNLELKHKPDDKIIGFDKRIAVTVATIIKAFLNEKENVVVYICDTSDNHEKARFHKFTNWFKTYNDGSIIQLKGVIHTGDVNILNAMLIHKNNSQLNEFIEAYEIITGIYTKPDDDELNNMLNEPEW